jgi:hypothetical protein
MCFFQLSVPITLYLAPPKVKGKVEYSFRTALHIADTENRIIREILPDLRHEPLYTTPAARSLPYNSQDPMRSQVRLIGFKDYEQLSGPQIQDILKNQHIFVTGVPHHRTDFNLETLSKFGHLHQVREIQGNDFGYCDAHETD